MTVEDRMPIWEFQCAKCKAKKEVYVLGKYFDIQWAQCPEGHGDMTRQPTAGNFELKGPGFYKNDYKK